VPLLTLPSLPPPPRPILQRARTIARQNTRDGDSPPVDMPTDMPTSMPTDRRGSSGPLVAGAGRKASITTRERKISMAEINADRRLVSAAARCYRRAASRSPARPNARPPVHPMCQRQCANARALARSSATRRPAA
jgi:hypothetical protein